MSRITQDNTTAYDTDYVWEIMYEYINPEVSLPYPEKRIAKDIPAGTRIWKHKENCQAECNKLLKSRT